MTTRAFNTEDQIAFADLSGDHNPVHLNAIEARRSQFGRIIVHGVDALLWALDQWLEPTQSRVSLARLKVEFRSAIGLGEPITLEIGEDDGEERKIRLSNSATGADAVRISVRLGSAFPPEAAPLPSIPRTPLQCRLRDISDLTSAEGEVELFLDRDVAGLLFPNLRRCLPEGQLATILATTRLVGMECPGYHSLFSGMDLTFVNSEPPLDGLRYHVTRCDARFSLVEIAVAGSGVQGVLRTFVRPSPHVQPGFVKVRETVVEGEFNEQRALVVGGSRGLGELITKLLAAGGAQVTTTYHVGEVDARRVTDEIAQSGTVIDYCRFDVLSPDVKSTSSIMDLVDVTHLYYLATPAIQLGTRSTFSPALFDIFCSYYVTGFANTLTTVRTASPALRHVVYPSSTAIDELPLNMGEYAAAKLAGEQLCAFLEKANPGLRIHTPRFPRLPSDQTSGVLRVEGSDAIGFLLGHLRTIALG